MCLAHQIKKRDFILIMYLKSVGKLIRGGKNTPKGLVSQRIFKYRGKKCSIQITIYKIRLSP